MGFLGWGDLKVRLRKKKDIYYIWPNKWTLASIQHTKGKSRKDNRSSLKQDSELFFIYLLFMVYYFILCSYHKIFNICFIVYYISTFFYPFSACFTSFMYFMFSLSILLIFPICVGLCIVAVMFPGKHLAHMLQKVLYKIKVYYYYYYYYPARLLH